MPFRSLSLWIVLCCLSPLAADEPTKQAKKKPSEPDKKIVRDTSPSPFPEGMNQFNGVLVGRLLTKDIETGEVVLRVDAVPRVWRNSKARSPKSIVGKNVKVDGVSGKWLDVLLQVRNGETLELEAKHNGGKKLTFPGELLRKVAPYKPSDYPELPEAFRGFNGAVAGKVLQKDAETLEMIVKVERVIDTSAKSRAKTPKSIEGRSLMLAGFWRRKDDFHSLKVGDSIEVGIQHIGQRSDHLSVDRFIRKAGAGTDKPKAKRDPEPTENARGGVPAGMRGYRGILIGKLVSKDVEKGEFLFVAESSKRVWRQNKAKDVKSCEGKTFQVRGVEGKFLDVLLSIKPGDRLEVEAFHNGGSHLDFVKEWLKKIE